MGGYSEGRLGLPVGRNLVLTPHIGVEYTDVVQEAFTESGEMARRFDRGHYRNLALPVGLSLTQGLTLAACPGAIRLAWSISRTCTGAMREPMHAWSATAMGGEWRVASRRGRE